MANLLAPDTGLDAAQPVAGTNLLPEVQPPSAFGAGVRAATSGMVSSAGGALSLIGAKTELPLLERAGGAITAKGDAMAVGSEPPIQKLSDIDSLTKVGQVAAYAVGNAAPQAAVALAGGILGKRLAGGFGAGIGVAAPNFVQETGGIYNDAVKAGTANAADRSIVGGAVAGALESLPELALLGAAGVFKGSPLLGRLLGEATGTSLSAKAVQIAKAAAGVGVGEAATEYAQTAVEQAASGSTEKNGGMGSQAAEDERQVSALLGAFGGVALGGAAGAVGQMRAPGAEANTPSAPSPATEAPAAAVGVPNTGTTEPTLGTPGTVDPATTSDADLAAQLNVEDARKVAEQGRLAARERVNKDTAQLAEAQKQLAATTAVVSNLQAELDNPERARSKQDVTRDLKTAQDHQAALDNALKNSELKQQIPARERFARSAQGTLIGEQPPVQAQSIYTGTQQSELATALETPAFQRTIEQVALINLTPNPFNDEKVSLPTPELVQAKASTLRSRMTYDNFRALEEQEAQKEAVAKQEPAAPTPSIAQVDTTGTIAIPGQTAVQPSASSIVSGQGEPVDSATLAALDVPAFQRDAVQKMQADRAAVPLLRNPDATVETPQPSAGGTPRESLKSGTIRDKTDYIMGEAERAVKEQAAPLVDAGLMKAQVAGRVQTAVITGIRAALTKDPSMAADTIKTAITDALKGKLNKADASTFADSVYEQIAEAPRVYYSRAATTPVDANYAVDVRQPDLGGDTADQLRESRPDFASLSVEQLKVAFDQLRQAMSEHREIQANNSSMSLENTARLKTVQMLLAKAASGGGTVQNSRAALDPITARNIAELEDAKARALAAGDKAAAKRFDKQIAAARGLPASPGVAAPTPSVDLAAAMIAINPHARRGALIYITSLRKALKDQLPTKEAFDKYILDAAKSGGFQLQNQAWPGRLTAEEREELIEAPRSPSGSSYEGQQYFDAIGIRMEYSKASVLGMSHLSSGVPIQKHFTHAADIVKSTAEFDGSTTDLNTGRSLANTQGVSVALYKDRERKIEGRPTEDDIKQFMADNYDVLSVPGTSLGTWFNTEDGHTYIDISKVVPVLEEAQRLAIQHNQPAVFDLHTMTTIPTANPEVLHEAATKAAAEDRYDRGMADRGRKVVDYLEFILGSPDRLEVRPYVSTDGTAGTYRSGTYKDIIEFAYNAKDVLSVGAHEGFHYLEKRVLSGDERVVVRRAFAPGSDLFNKLVDRAKAYDAANKTNITEEIRANPIEARAYGFEFWKRGELTAGGPLARVWQKIKQFIEKVRNRIDGFGFTSYEDLFTAVDKGIYAKREAAGIRVNSLVPDDGYNHLALALVPGAKGVFAEPAKASSNLMPPGGKLQEVLHSKAATVEMIQRAREGELEPTQLRRALANQLDNAGVGEDFKDSVFGFAAAGKALATDKFRTFYENNIASGQYLSRTSAGYKNVFSALTYYSQRKNRLISQAVDRDLSSWVKKGSDSDRAAVSRVLLERTINGWTDTSPELSAELSKMSALQTEMYNQARSMISSQLVAEFEADKRSYARLLGDGSPEYKEWLDARTLQVDSLIKSGYFPERRYGDHVVHVYLPTKDGKKLTMYFEAHEGKLAAEKRVSDLTTAVEKYPELKVEYGYKYKAEYNGSLSYQQFMDMARRQGVEMTQSERERIAKALISADSTKRNRVFRRENVPGMSKDGMRILAEFGVTMSNKIAYSEMGESVQSALNGDAVDVKFDTSGRPVINTQAGANVWEQDGPLSGFYHSLADKTVDFVMDPAPNAKLSSALRTAASFQFLGGSISTALVNLSSLGMNTVPYLTKDTTYTNAFTQTLAGTKLAMQHRNTIADLAKLSDPNTKLEGIDSVPGLRDAITVAAQDGTVLDTEIYQIMGLTRGQQWSLGRAHRAALEKWMLPFRLTEQYNRIGTFIAAYKIAQSKGMTGDALYKYAQETVYSTQFRYDEANRPAFARGPLGAVLFTFKTYPIFMAETMYALSKENPKAAVIMLLSLSMAAGIEGLPFAEDIMDLIDTVSERLFHSPFNTNRALRNTLKSASEAITGTDLSQVFMHGAINSLTGMNFASRVGMGNFIPGTRLGTADADFKQIAMEILGPAGGYIPQLFEGAGMINRGQLMAGAQKMLPLAAQNLVKGTQQLMNGYATDSGGRKLIDVSGPEAFAQSLGFSSAALSQAYEADRMDKQNLAFYQQVHQDYMLDLRKAAQAGNTQKITEVVDAIVSWNKAHPDMPLTVSPNSFRKTVAEAGLPINQRTMMQLPKQLRANSEFAIGLTHQGE